MEPYIFYGKILPEEEFSHLTSGKRGKAKVSAKLNQLVVIVHTEEEWNIFDLRNVVKNIVQNNLSIVGYLKGYAYDLDIIRVINSALNIDQVFGIDIPCLSQPRQSINLANELAKIKAKNFGQNGIFLDRCFNDLISSMKNADDTAFYCYRAIESLRHHCAAVNGLSQADKKLQWEKFRKITQVKEETINILKDSAEAVRHGEATKITDKERVTLFQTTWSIVENYLTKI
jgi:hypothetical protein